MEFVMTVGLPASLKSTWAREQIEKGYDWISSDEIRKAHDYNIENADVFAEMEEQVFTSLAAGHSVVYDATNLSHKRRKFIVDRVIYYNPAIYLRCEVFIAPLDILQERNSHRSGAECVPEEVFQKFIRGFQFPQYFEGWNEININELSVFDKLDMLQFYGFDQKNPFHTADLGTHLLNARHYCEEHEFFHIVQDAAWFHDIGKYYTQTMGPDGVAHYYGHENVGAYYFALCCWNSAMWTKEEKLMILFLINYHMRPYHWTAAAYKRDYKLFGARDIYWLKQLHQADINAH